MSRPDWETAGFGLYIHWPFCQAKCPYCDFNSHVVSHIDQTRWANAYVSEIRRVASETPDRVLRSVFFGGGTPSLMAPEVVAAVLDTVRSAWPTANDIEITLEANPTSVEAGRFQGYRDAGVNRISMGVQALNDADLRGLGRLHTAAEAKAAYDIARSVFDRVSFDLIYARQHQSLTDWSAELGEALSMAIDHLSLYQLTIEVGTAFADRQARGGLAGLPEDDLAADMYEVTQELCDKAGLPAYEISNHAGDLAQSQHNLIYWRSGDWAGIGPGAHGRLTLDGTRYATETPLAPMAWIGAVERAGTGETLRQALSPEDHGVEYIMMGLRLRDGVELDRLRCISGTNLAPDRIDHLQGLGLVAVENGMLRTTAAGRPVLNAILRDLLI
ncbi:Radical SAM family enzyme, similar to coproporphyrinogen III oxidase, oxygen-independent [Roseibacterium elongatum DSM 19469]|uniref:Heme chaperone HemW n=1 Tax=Roseicyclus elongatus DSM 19469 TaxID=1294273 RepID=W8SLR1_9RHOB|nr:radical SAM family heme chaperone HemW [Roseibacterium elongatum]AHM03450.1 Radical SAM family enzyme, similar to coproporphyrinogen III oxidase, oxygen-independent [Roseibacterium elongatum DSM 19469]